MANPQPDKFTRISNELLEELAKTRLNGYEFKVLLIILRLTYGYNKKMDNISISQFCKYTDIRASHIVRTLHQLFSKKMIIREVTGKINKYGINKNYDEWEITAFAYNRNEVFKKNNYTCTYCNKKYDTSKLEVDHIIPLAKNGSNNINNLTTSCITCNRRKNKSLPKLGVLPNQGISQEDSKPLPNQGIKVLPNQGNTKDIYKDNTTKETVNKLTGREAFGNQDINLILTSLKEKMGLPRLDLSERVNRRYAAILLRSSKKGVEGVLWLIDTASRDPWFRNHITSVRDLWSNQVKIIASVRAKRREYVEI